MPKLDRTALEARRAQLEAERGEPMTLDHLTAEWSMFQRRRGHRHSTDDLTTAWYAVTHAPPSPRRLLDLGTGIGTVGLSVLWKFPDAHLTAVEVQAVSYAILRENVEANGLEDRVATIHGDMRDFNPDPVFELVTGSPPYFDVADGIVSADSQRAAARFELHGDVRDYCAAARRALAPNGHFVFCFPTPQIERAFDACKMHRFAVRSRCDVEPRKSYAPLFTLFWTMREEDVPNAETTIEAPLVVRTDAGVHTPEMLRVRQTFGFALGE
ncbi:MAG TPA: methyltransferase [Polyangiaceae bacterium]